MGTLHRRRNLVRAECLAWRCATLAAALPAAGAFSQSYTAYLQFPQGNTYKGGSKPVRVVLWIEFDQPAFTSLAGWKGHVFGGAGSFWSGMSSALVKPGVGMSVGTPSGTGVVDIVVGQLGYLPPGPAVPTQNTASPLLIWEAD